MTPTREPTNVSGRTLMPIRLGKGRVIRTQRSVHLVRRNVQEAECLVLCARRLLRRSRAASRTKALHAGPLPSGADDLIEPLDNVSQFFGRGASQLGAYALGGKRADLADFDP